MLIWSTVQLVTTIIILVFIREENFNHQEKETTAEKEKKKEIEIEPHLKSIIPIFIELIKNENTLLFVCFTIACSAASAIPRNILEVYLTNDLGMPKESLSLMQVFFTPMNILLAFLSGYLTAKAPFRALMIAYSVDILLSAYSIFVLVGTFPAANAISNLTVTHVGAYFVVRNLLSTFETVSTFAFIL